MTRSQSCEMLNENHNGKSAKSRGRDEVTLERLPPVVKEGTPVLHHQPLKYQTKFQEKLSEDRQRARIDMNERQQDYSHERFHQAKYCPQRQYNSARAVYNVYSEVHDDTAPVRKEDGVYMALPLKPVYHKRAFCLERARNDKVPLKPNEFQRLSPPQVPSAPRGHSEYDTRVGKACHRRPAEDLSLPSEDHTHCTGITGSQPFRGELRQLPDEQQRLAREIREKERILKEKLLRTEEEVRKKIQRERAASGDDTKRRERHARRPVECEEWTENKVSSAERRREMENGQERPRRERLMKREKTQEEFEWQRKEEQTRERREKKTLAEGWERRGREMVNKPDLSKEIGKTVRDIERGSEWNRGNGKNEKDMKREREKMLEWNRRESEKAREGTRNRRIVDEDLDWEREKAREGTRNRRIVDEDLDWEREKGREGTQNRRIVDEDLHWEREKAREGTQNRRIVDEDLHWEREKGREGTRNRRIVDEDLDWEREKGREGTRNRRIVDEDLHWEREKEREGTRNRKIVDEDLHWEREKEREGTRNRKIVDEDLDWEREKAREGTQNRKIVDEDLHWERENKWERSREKYVSRDDKRRQEHDIAQGPTREGQLKPARRLVPGSSSSSSRRMPREPSRTSVASLPHSSKLLQAELSPVERADASPQLIPCRICHRNFAAERLEKHLKVCEKTQRSNRKVFDSSRYRAKGTDLEEFLKTNPRSKTPEIKKNNWRQKHEAFIRNVRQVHVPAVGDLQPQPSIEDNPDYVTCPHCARRFAPGPAERHIPMCQNIKSRPKPLRRRS